MSFWDSIKPAKKTVRCTALEVSADSRSLSLAWDDGKKSVLTARALRQFCPCAECVDEWSGKRTFEQDSIAEDMKLLEQKGVGNYAVTFTFGDMHRTGIFNWEYLRELSERFGFVP